MDDLSENDDLPRAAEFAVAALLIALIFLILGYSLAVLVMALRAGAV